NAGADKVTCSNDPVTLSAFAATGGNWTGGAGSFSPDRNTATATYTPAVSEIGTVLTLTWNIPDPDGSGPCTTSSDAMTIKSNVPNIANAGPDFIVCGQTPVTFGANAVSRGFWTGGVGTFMPDRNTANAMYTPAISEV